MISKRASKFTSFIVMDVMAKAEELERQGEKVIHMEVGEGLMRVANLELAVEFRQTLGDAIDVRPNP